jgi:hypothetical protein
VSLAACYFGGALDAFFAASAAAAFFRDSFATCFFSAASLRGLELTAAELSLGLVCRVPGVSDAPGVPGVRSVAAPDGAAAFGPPACPLSSGETCPQALIQSNAATGSTANQIVRVYTMITSYDQETYINP